LQQKGYIGVYAYVLFVKLAEKEVFSQPDVLRLCFSGFD
jgi:hypothetical protein